jgi:Helix-turn-helix domain
VTTTVTVARRLAALREERRVSVRQLSARLEALGHKILPQGITKIEKGKRGVDVDDLVALARALNVYPVDLVVDPADPGAQATRGWWGGLPAYAQHYVFAQVAEASGVGVRRHRGDFPLGARRGPGRTTQRG